jgi:NAD(P)H-dependent FMN reductase
MITIISATNRKNSLTLKIAEFYSELLKQNNVENQVMDLCDLPTDFMFSNFYGSSTQNFEDMVKKYINKAERFVVISPEYHGSYPGIFKALIDCVGGEDIKMKKVALVGVATGRAGNLRGMEHLTALFHHLRAEVFSSKPKLSEVHKLLNEDGKIENPETVKLLQDQIESFVNF